MINQVATALREELKRIGYGVGTINADQLSDALTRVAIEAMRSRTPAMERAALHAYDDAIDGKISTDHPLEAAWEAAIDAALQQS